MVLKEAGVEAVDAFLEELATDGVGSSDLADLLVYIGDKKAVPLLKKKFDRGDFKPYGGTQSDVKNFVEKYPDLYGEVETVKCALCGKTGPVTSMRGVAGGKFFCLDTCWGNRGRVLPHGIGTDCPYYSEGMCKAGDGDNLCSLWSGSYKISCIVYSMKRQGSI
jgi:hypothetical protein